MADEVDQTSDREEHLMNLRIQAIDTNPVAEHTGSCLWCDEPLKYPRRWCNRECAFEWERRA